ncbi:GNAT family N-acetyltransferase [Alicyclobacillus sp. ALC3]|uniref:GNAT family N-acetyltransferase n=1 Tax=Alicyclobacillus sp. ALC3 TaxID=2796143 RepID=UPI002378EF4C|nr:GNAT family N-acetyltransferase [Alicyclobacillus sp. ALC3]WDL97482.1 GNAT family N-acetyltransferase [Alicyclobacillus sp. ALC3]
MSRVILRDGRVCEFRTLCDTDEDRRLLKDLFHRVSAQSMYYRFFHATRDVPDEFLQQLTEGNGLQRLGIVCLSADRAIAVGSYTAESPSAAEVSMLVEDTLQGRGVGTLLLEHLAEHAYRHGYRQFVARVLSDNQKMIRMFATSGYEFATARHGTEVEFVLPLTQTERQQAMQAAREKLATVTSLLPFLQPRTVAVVAADPGARNLRDTLLAHLRSSWYTGRVFSARSESCKGDATATLAALSEPVDLAVLVGTPERILHLVDECSVAHVRGVVIASPGFAEHGQTGEDIERKIVQKLRAAGIRLLGPNSLGLLNTASEIRANLSFAESLPEQGDLAIASQSGSLGLAMMRYASRIGIGVSSFVSMGNKADISGNDLLQVWEDDPSTRIIALHLESFGNPRKFARIARRVTREKPILVVKGARSSTGALVSESRQPTLAVSDRLVRALFEQTGILQLDSVQELLETAALLSMSPLPEGRRIGIVSNTAGGAVLAADALRTHGLELAVRPTDLGFKESGAGYEAAVTAYLNNPNIDAVLVIFVCVGFADEANVLEHVSAAVRSYHQSHRMQERAPSRNSSTLPKPIVAIVMTDEMEVRYVYADGDRIPVYPFPEQAIRALARATDYHDYLRCPRGHLPDLDGYDRDTLQALVRRFANSGRREMNSAEIQPLLSAAGIQVSPVVSGSIPQVSQLQLWVECMEDAWFGPVLRVGCRIEPPPSGADILRILPLTDLDAKTVVSGLEEQWTAGGVLTSGHPLSEQQRLALRALLLRVSRLMDEGLGIEQVTLGHVVVSAQGAPFVLHGHCRLRGDWVVRSSV